MTTNGKRIGYVDLNLENFHANVYLKAYRNELCGRGFTVSACTGLLEAEGRAWAAKNGVPYYADIAAMDRHVDVYMILAPSNPEVHWELCQKVFPFGKATYVDKTFTTDAPTAKAIFALADRHGVAMQTTSALRYTAVQKAAAEMRADDLRHMVAWGGGRSFGEYAIHPVELVVSCLGAEATALMRRGDGEQSQLLLDFSGGRSAVVNVYTNANTPFAATLTSAKETRHVPVDGGRLFIDTAAAIADFYESGVPSIDRAQSLMIRRILDVADAPEARERFVALA